MACLAHLLRPQHHMNNFPGKSLQLSIGQLISVAGLTGIWCAFASGGHLPDFRWVPFGFGLRELIIQYETEPQFFWDATKHGFKCMLSDERCTESYGRIYAQGWRHHKILILE